jgi:hypothetical protein
MAGKTKLSQIRDEQMPKRPKSVLSKMSEQERTLREQIRQGGQSLGLTFRDPTAGIIEADPFEMATGMPLTDGNEDYDALTRTALGGVQGMATPAYLQEGYQGPQTGMGPVGDFAAGLGQVFQGGSGAGSMGAPALAVSQFAGDIPDATRALGTMGGTKAPRGLGNKLSELMASGTEAERAALAKRLTVEAGQAGGQSSAVPRDQALANLIDQPDPGITAYHGSPHTFDKFDMSKIGTGEGAQAYGHGLYFAENEGVAKGYRDTLTKSGNDGARKKLERAGGDIDQAIADAKAKAEKYRAGGADSYAKVTEEDLRFLEDYKRNGGWNEGSMYQVRLNVKPDELLDWDRPLSEQPESVRKALQNSAQGYYADKNMKYGHPAAKALIEGKSETEHGPLTGQEGYRYAGHVAQQPEISGRLKAAGIKGIRYKDAGSRSGEGGTYNYVIFDDKLVTILKRYGVPMTAGAGGAMIVSGANMPPDVAAQLGPQS